ncbi:MAG: hypothetical protein EON96_00590 [Caulobacteraceae bacterium]|nr:MAG: hypothetical protein EON96_00590 [Caulobacteraceae bacterium]
MNLSNTFLRLAVVFALIGIALGAWMGGSGDHGLMGVHAHINLLGWVSMFLYGLFYRAVPEAAVGLLARVHFWIAVVGFLIFMPALTVALSNYTPLMGAATIGLMAGPLMVFIGMILFAIIVFRATGRPRT